MFTHGGMKSTYSITDVTGLSRQLRNGIDSGRTLYGIGQWYAENSKRRAC